MATSTDLGGIQRCLESSREYFIQTEGHRPDGDAAEQMVADAEADDARRVFAITLRKSGAIVGVLDLHLDYPEPLVAQIGLLLFERSNQGQGYGREIVSGLESTLERVGFRALRLAVVDENELAKPFWERLGFDPVGRLDRGVTVYEKPLRTPSRSNDSMKKYVCDPCGYVYDPAVGDPDSGVEPGTPFESLPDDWTCPVCGAGKGDFSPQD